MKQPKKLTREQKECLSAHYLNCKDWMRVFSKIFGIVEFSDGVRRVDPTDICFCDEENQMLSEMEKFENE